MQVTRQRRTHGVGSDAPGGAAGSASSPPARPPSSSPAAALAAASTTGFGHHQVGTQYRDGLQVSADQVIKPLGDRLVTKFGKFMGSTVSPDGRFLAATSTDKSVALQVFDLATTS